MSELVLPGLWLPERKITVPRLGAWWRRTKPQDLVEWLITIPQTPIAAAGTSVTIPTHIAGDLMIVGAYNNAAATLATTPTAGGTVPTWNTIDAPAGANLNSLKVVWAAAAGTTDTSGSWTNATHMVAIVLRGQAAAPLGAHAQGGTAAANSSIAPAITLQNLSGSSLVLAIHFHKGVTAFGAAPSGWTQRLASTTGLVAVNTLNDTTASPGAVTQTDTSVSGGYRGETIEILALALAPPFQARTARHMLLRR